MAARRGGHAPPHPPRPRRVVSSARRSAWAGLRVVRVFILSLVLLLTSCARTPVQSALVISSDRELASLAAELLPDLAARAGLELKSPVRLERRSREQLVAYLTAKLDDELSPALADKLSRSYALLGLIPPEVDLRALLLSIYTEQVAGFYDPDSTALFVMEDQPPETLHTVLIHELVHAVQDQAVDLDSLTARERGNDRQTAAQAAIEGHATVVMLEYAMEQSQGRRVDLSEVEGFAGLIRSTMGATRAQFPALGSAPRVLQEALLFPYLEGATFAQSVWRRSDDRAAPVTEQLPQSTEQVMHPEKVTGADRDDPLQIELHVPGATVLHQDGLGQLETRLFVEELTGDREVEGTAEGWAGDKYALVESPAGDALAWVLLWDQPVHRDAFAERVAPQLGRLPARAQLDALDVDGVAGLLLRIGEIAEVEASLLGGGFGGAPAAGASRP